MFRTVGTAHLQRPMPDRIQRSACPQCGANLAFSPETAMLQCRYCGWENAIQTGNRAAIVEQNYHAHRQQWTIEASQLSSLSPSALEVGCDNCGATTTFEPLQMMGTCPFCASPIIPEAHAASPVITPHGVVPFSVGQRDALDQLKKWLNFQWLAPDDLRRLIQTEQLQGIYLPFWTYDVDTSTDYRGEREQSHYTTETYRTKDNHGNPVTKTREVRHTAWYPARGQLSRCFDDVLIAATTAISNDLLDTLKPWQLPDSLRSYNASFLVGFRVQHPQISLEDGFQRAKKVMHQQIYRDVKRNIGGDDQRVSSINTRYNTITFKHILLPVWLMTYRYRNKQFHVLVNAHTGAVQGERPYSIWKVVLLMIAGSIAIGVALWLIMKYG